MQIDTTTTVADAPVFLTGPQLCQRWAFNPRKLWCLRKAGKLKAFRIGGSIRYRISEVEALEEASVVTG